MAFLTSEQPEMQHIDRHAANTIAHAMRRLAKQMQTEPAGNSIAPVDLKQALGRVDGRFASYQQQDSHECLRVLLGGLHDNLNRIKVAPAYETIPDGDPSEALGAKAARWWSNYTSRNDSIVTDVFAGQLQSTLVCCMCANRRVTYDPFMDLSLPIPPSPSSFTSPSLSSPPSLGSCLQQLLRDELITGHDQVYCTMCQTHRDHHKSMQITRWPSVLVLQLKRFSQDTKHTPHKVDCVVTYPARLDCGAMQTTSSQAGPEGPVYDLYATSNHSGGLGGGHYTATCAVGNAQQSESNLFYTFDDSSVGPSLPSASSTMSLATAYVLFYAMQTNSQNGHER